MSSRDEYATIRSAYIRILYSSMQVADQMCINMQASHASMNTYGYMHTKDIIRIQISLHICKKHIHRNHHARLHCGAHLQLQLLGPDMQFGNEYQTTKIYSARLGIYRGAIRLAYFINHDERLQYQSG